MGHHPSDDNKVPIGYYSKRAGSTKMNKSGLWSHNSTLVQDTNSKGALISKFIENAEGEAFVAYVEMTLKTTTLNIADKVVEYLAERNIKGVVKSDETKFLAVESPEVLVLVSDEDRRNDSPAYDVDDTTEETDPSLFNPRVGIFSVTAVGNRDIVSYILTSAKKTYQSERFARIKWWYDEGGRTTYKTIYIDNPNTQLLKEFYPGLEPSPEEFIKDYLKSESSVLLLAGPPGTGKTTLLRHMIYKHNLSASVVYDEGLMKRDSVFQSFLFNKSEDVLIVEDADLILAARDLENNKLMSRFLNISDGLIKLPNKKLIFTTNLSDFNRVDEALMRAGRCFAVVQTRKLHHGEAIAAAKAAGLAIPFEDREYSVAELFNDDGGKTPRRKVGFK